MFRSFRAKRRLYALRRLRKNPPACSIRLGDSGPVWPHRCLACCNERPNRAIESGIAEEAITAATPRSGYRRSWRGRRGNRADIRAAYCKSHKKIIPIDFDVVSSFILPLEKGGKEIWIFVE
jgi:hypothetical protein